MSNRKSIENRRKHLQEQERSLRQRQDQSDNRDALDATIANLEQDLSDARRRLHRTPDANQQALELREETLRQLKKQKLELDRQLDVSEDLTAERLHTARQELRLHILEEDPSQKVVWEERVRQLDLCRDTLNAIDELLGMGDDLARFLERGIAEGQSMRRGGWLRYIAGTNPNLVMIACLVGMETTADQLTYKWSSSKVMTEPLREEMLDLLGQIKRRSQAKWRWSTLPKLLSSDLTELQKVIHALRQIRRDATKEYSQAELHLERWLFEAQ